MLLLFVLSVAGLTTPTTSDITAPVIWTQKSGNWSKLRGFKKLPDNGIESDITFRNYYLYSTPQAGSYYWSIDYDVKENKIYWLDRNNMQIYRRVLSNISDWYNPISFSDIHMISQHSLNYKINIGDFAIDSSTGNLFITELNWQSIGCIGKLKNGTIIYKRIHFIKDGNLSAIAFDYINGRIFWADNATGNIETSFSDGSQRKIIQKIYSVLSIALDLSDSKIFLLQKTINGSVIMKLNYFGEKLNEFSNNIPCRSITIYRDKIFATTEDLRIVEFYKITGNLLRHVSVDASTNQIVAIQETMPPNLCENLRCEYFCLNVDGIGICGCPDGYYLNIDNIKCTYSQSTYLLSIGDSIVLAKAYSIEVNSSVLNPNKKFTIPLETYADKLGEARWLALDFNGGANDTMVAFSNSINGTISFVSLEGTNITEETVQEDNIEGISFNWEDGYIMWIESKKMRIMILHSKNKYHKLFRRNINDPKGLAIDPNSGEVYWSQLSEPNGNRQICKISLTAKLDSRESCLLYIYGNDLQEIVLDLRMGRLYWSDNILDHIYYINYNSQNPQNDISSLNISQAGFFTVLKNFQVLTNPNKWLEFYVNNDAVGFIEFFWSSKVIVPSFPQHQYDVLNFDDYLQPRIETKCASKKCSHFCMESLSTSNCSCAIGYVLKSDQIRCVSEIRSSQSIFFLDSYHRHVYKFEPIFTNKSFSSNSAPLLDLDSIQAIPHLAYFRPTAMALNPKSGIIYYFDAGRFIEMNPGEGTTRILYGQDVQPTGDMRKRFERKFDNTKMALDIQNQKLYFTNKTNGSISILDIATLTVSPWKLNLNQPSAIIINPISRKIYWTEVNKISWCNISDNCQPFSQQFSNEPMAIDVTSDDKIIYVADDSSIYSYSLPSLTENETFIFRDPELHLSSITASPNYIFFTAWNSKSIHLVDLNTLEMNVVFEDIFARVHDVKYSPDFVLSIPMTVPTASIVGEIIGIVLGLLLLLLLFLLLLFLIRKRNRDKKPEKPGETGNSEVVDNDSEIFGNIKDGEVIVRRDPGRTSANPDRPKSIIQKVMGFRLQKNRNTAKPILSMLPPGYENHDFTKGDPNSPTGNGAHPKPLSPQPKLSSRHFLKKQISHVLSNDDKTTAVQPSSPHRNETSRPPSHHTSWVDPNPLPAIGPEAPQPPGPASRYIHIPPKMHQQPRGFAPASHAVPTGLKNTIGRNKFKWNVKL